MSAYTIIFRESSTASLARSSPMQEAGDAQIDYQNAIHCTIISSDYSLTVDWNGVPATMDGIMGGFGEGTVPTVDVESSLQFLAKIKSLLPANYRAADCGAGIGRVTRDVLLKVADVVDLIEPVEKFASEIKHCDSLAHARAQGRIGTVYEFGLQHWKPKGNLYGLIWCQWCIGHLKNDDFVDFLKLASTALVPNGLIVVKENVTEVDTFDSLDSSVTRSEQSFKKIFQEAGLKILAQ